MKRLICYVVFALILVFSGMCYANDVIVFTETSSTDLSVTVNGSAFGSVTYVGPDKWYWRYPYPSGTDFPSLTILLKSPSTWAEPDNSATSNTLALSQPPDNSLVIVNSDVSVQAALQNGDIVSSSLTFAYSINGGTYTNYPYDVRFLDRGDTVNTPEPATMLLFGFGLAGLAGVRRFK